MAKEKEFKIKFKKDVNGAWSGYALMRKPDGKVYRLTAAACPGIKATTAKKDVKNMLDEMVEDYKVRVPGSVRISIEEAE